MLFGTTQRNFTSRFIKEIDKNLIEKKDNTIVGKSDKPPVQAVKSMSLQQQLAKNKSKSVPSASAALYSAGERVKHNIFGEGTILSVKQMASDAMLKLHLEKWVLKIMATFAKITENIKNSQKNYTSENYPVFVSQKNYHSHNYHCSHQFIVVEITIVTAAARTKELK